MPANMYAVYSVDLLYKQYNTVVSNDLTKTLSSWDEMKRLWIAPPLLETLLKCQKNDKGW